MVVAVKCLNWSYFKQCFHDHSFKSPFTISKIPFFPQNSLAAQTVEKIKKIQTNLRQMYHIIHIDPTRNRVWTMAYRLGHKVITLPENLGKLSRVPFTKVSAPHICLCSSRGVGCLIIVEGSNGRRR